MSRHARITRSPYRFRARPWDIEQAGSVCTLCPSQCNVGFTVRDEVLLITTKDDEKSLRSVRVYPVGDLIGGEVDKDGVDVFQISGRVGETWRFEVLAHRFGSPFEPILRLRDPRGRAGGT